MERVRQVAGCLPSGAAVLVVSRGDDSLLDLAASRGQHSLNRTGVYAGHYPADARYRPSRGLRGSK